MCQLVLSFAYLKSLSSIAPILRIIPTSGSNPVVVLADDMNEYVCKYIGRTPAKKLLIEYLCSAFASIWGISVPEPAFVKILAEHVPGEMLSNSFHAQYFEIPTIGSLNYPESKEIDKSVIASWRSKPSQIKWITNKEDFLQIGLFDLWLANEDRNHNNFNLLLNPIIGGIEVMAIDHEKCFNSGIIDPVRPPYQLTVDESILSSDIVPLLFRQGDELDRLKDVILGEFPGWVEACQNQLVEIIQLIPLEWGINREEIEEFLNSNIFAPLWRDETEHNFRQYITDSFVNR